MNHKVNHQIGNLGERLAVKYLRGKEFEILDVNVHLGKYAELDIVAQKNEVIHFVEVKTGTSSGRNSQNVIFPIYNITPRKVRHLSMGAEMYIRNNNLEEYDRTIDAIGVVINRELKKSWIKMFPNILEGI